MPARIAASSVEFAEYRKYVPGDDLRRLDWRAYGRSDRFYVKEFEADTNLRCCLVLDTSGSMGFGSTGVTKIEYARRIAGTLGYLAVQQGDAVGLACVADGIVQQRAAAAQSGASAGRVRSAGAGQARRARRSWLPVLHELAETIRQRALIVIISDLFVEPAVLRELLPALALPQARRGRVSPARPAGAGASTSAGRCGSSTWKAARRSSPSRTTSPTATTRRWSSTCDELKQVVLESAVDYHRVTHRRGLRAGAGAVPGRPDAGEGACDELPPAAGCWPRCRSSALPIIIHLINQRRFQTIRWAAMMFLLAANRMSRGYARLRQWLILLFRMLADRRAGLRGQPAAGQRLAGPGRRRPAGHDDRPARPLAQHAAARRRRAATRSWKPAVQQLAQTLGTLGSNRWVLIDSAIARAARAGVARRACSTSPSAGPASASADLPAMLQAAHDYIRDQPRGPDRDLDLLRPARRTTGTPKAAAGRRCATPSWSSRRACGFICSPIRKPPTATWRCA